ncbi:hypothetical protein HYT59_00810 [Candidatus Woesebacteria bacterium]|nr:hypothetical protein [Candidatus Woesebacteria bacterium]
MLRDFEKSFELSAQEKLAAAKGRFRLLHRLAHYGVLSSDQQVEYDTLVGDLLSADQAKFMAGVFQEPKQIGKSLISEPHKQVKDLTFTNDLLTQLQREDKVRQSQRLFEKLAGITDPLLERRPKTIDPAEDPFDLKSPKRFPDILNKEDRFKKSQ